MYTWPAKGTKGGISHFKMTKLKPILTGDIEKLVTKFLMLQTGEDVANFFELPYGQLLYLLYKKADKQKYYSFDIPKKTGGFRGISKPTKGIDILQKKLLPILVSLYRVKAPVHGFVKGKSIVTNAKQHKKIKYVLNIDLANFYGSINYGRVRGLFLAKPFSLGRKAASIIAQLLCFKNSLPQGASTSPIISNLIASALDKKMMLLARRYHVKYTRYADDISFSCNKKSFPKSLAFFEEGTSFPNLTLAGKTLEDAVDSSGFRINHKKVRLQINSVRQEVTGLTVNEYPNVKRKFVRQIRSMIHAVATVGKVQAELDYLAKYAKKEIKISPDKLDGSYFMSVIYGKLSFLHMVKGADDPILAKYAIKIGQLDASPPNFIKKIMVTKEMFDIFIGHASEDKNEIAIPIFEECEKQGVNAFIDEKYIKWGDSLTDKINNALSQSKFFLAILSEHSIDKAWPQKELNSAISLDISGEQKVLPLIVGDYTVILKKFPLISDKFHVVWNKNPQEIVARLKDNIT